MPRQSQRWNIWTCECGVLIEPETGPDHRVVTTQACPGRPREPLYSRAWFKREVLPHLDADNARARQWFDKNVEGTEDESHTMLVLGLARAWTERYGSQRAALRAVLSDDYLPPAKLWSGDRSGVFRNAALDDLVKHVEDRIRAIQEQSPCPLSLESEAYSEEA